VLMINRYAVYPRAGLDVPRFWSEPVSLRHMLCGMMTIDNLRQPGQPSAISAKPEELKLGERVSKMTMRGGALFENLVWCRFCLSYLTYNALMRETNVPSSTEAIVM
jgi:hypothetical protein